MAAIPAFLCAPLFGEDGHDARRAERRADAAETEGPRHESLSAESSPDFARWTRICQNDESAFAELFDTYWAPLCRFAERIVRSRDAARDIVQDVMIRVWDSRHAAEVRTSVRAYLYTSVRNRALHHTAHDRIVESTEAFFTTLGASPAMGERSARADDLAARHELAVVLDRAIAALPPRTRQVALLKWGDELSRTEIAHVLGVSPFTVDKQISSATRAMRVALDGFLSDPPAALE